MSARLRFLKYRLKEFPWRPYYIKGMLCTISPASSAHDTEHLMAHSSQRMHRCILHFHCVYLYLCCPSYSAWILVHHLICLLITHLLRTLLPRPDLQCSNFPIPLTSLAYRLALPRTLHTHYVSLDFRHVCIHTIVVSACMFISSQYIAIRHCVLRMMEI